MTLKKSQIYMLITSAVVIFLIASSIYIVHEGEYKVVLQFGEAVRVSEEPGMHFKVPFIETTSTLPKYQMIYDSEPTPILTRDKKPIIVDNYTIWRITDTTAFLQTLQTVAAATNRIDTAVYNAVRRKLSETDYGDIISEETARGNLNADITQEVYEVMKRDNYGLEIVDVRIKRTDLPEENKEAVYNRMISDRYAIAAQYLSEGDEAARRITSNADRQAIELLAAAEAEAKEIIAEGEQEAARTYNQAYGQDPAFYELYRTLQSYRTSFAGSPVIMIPINSPYTRLLLGLE